VNNFIPAMIAVLLAETGGRSMQFARLPRLALAAMLLGVAVGIAAFAGNSIAPEMNPYARALMLGIALILTGCGQFGKPASGDPPASLWATLLFVWRSGAPFLAFAFSLWRAAPVGAAAGALAGMVGAAAFGAVHMPASYLIALRRAAGAVLIMTGFYAAFWALRLIT
jgi:Ca2+/H+ antiporter, TMEM165/GDT1 family